MVNILIVVKLIGVKVGRRAETPHNLFSPAYDFFSPPEPSPIIFQSITIFNLFSLLQLSLVFFK